MSEKERKFYLFSILGLGLALVLALAYGIWEHGTVRELKLKLNQRDTIKEVVVKTDTVKDTIPKVVVEKEVGVIKVPVFGNIGSTKPAYSSQNGDIKQKSGLESGLIDENSAEIGVIRDTLTLPLTQKEYSDDSTYTAWVSGYLPCLDSIKVYRKTIYEKQTITIPAEKKKRTFWQRFGVGVQTGYGLGLDDKKAHPYVGVGIGFNF